jgi:hypothetical protein
MVTMVGGEGMVTLTLNREYNSRSIFSSRFSYNSNPASGESRWNIDQNIIEDNIEERRQGFYSSLQSLFPNERQNDNTITFGVQGYIDEHSDLPEETNEITTDNLNVNNTQTNNNITFGHSDLEDDNSNHILPLSDLSVL